MSPIREQLRSAAEQFCQAFAAKKPLDELLKYFSNKRPPVVLEHGLQTLTPFTGKPFEGIEGIKKYFETISSHLLFEKMSFSSDYIVDVEYLKVSVKGEATFIWQSTGQSWPEIFIYALEFDDDLKVVKYEIWADTGAAYLASKGDLQEQ